MAVIQSRGVAANQGFLKYYFVRLCSRDQGEWARYKQGGRSSGVAVKRGSAVVAIYLHSSILVCTCSHILTDLSLITVDYQHIIHFLTFMY